MFRLWGKILHHQRIIQQKTFEIERPDLHLMDLIYLALDDFTLAFDIERPMWFDKNTKEIIRFKKTSFHKDQFIETIGFDAFEIEILEIDQHK